MSNLRLDLTERVAWMTLERLPSNLIDAATLRELDMALDEVARNRDASILVLSGAGTEAFCGGLDLSGLDPDGFGELIKSFHAIVKKLVRLPQAIVVAVDGVALGAGMALVCIGDVVVASDRSRLGFTQIRRAGFSAVGAVTLPTICGRPVASDLVLSGGTIDAARAKAVGLVSRVFPAEEFDESLQGVVARMGEHSPAVMRLTAQAMRARWLAGFDAALDAAERVHLIELRKEPDMAEGLQAAQEGRKPVWR
jgi:enoyl-CoA hydratase/carnithine racemase